MAYAEIDEAHKQMNSDYKFIRTRLFAHVISVGGNGMTHIKHSLFGPNTDRYKMVTD